MESVFVKARAPVVGEGGTTVACTGFFVTVGAGVSDGGTAVVGSGVGEGGNVFVGEGTAAVSADETACSTAAVEV